MMFFLGMFVGAILVIVISLAMIGADALEDNRKARQDGRPSRADEKYNSRSL